MTPTTTHRSHSGLPVWLTRLGVLTLAVMLISAPAGTVFADDHDEEEEEEYLEEEMIEQELLIQSVELFERLLGLVKTMESITKSSTLSAVAAVMGVEDHVDGPGEMVEMLEPMLEQSDDDIVKRAIRFKLIEAYGELDMQAKAREHLKALILQTDE